MGIQRPSEPNFPAVLFRRLPPMDGYTYCSPDGGLDVLVEQRLAAGPLAVLPDASPFLEPLHHAGQPAWLDNAELLAGTKVLQGSESA